MLDLDPWKNAGFWKAMVPYIMKRATLSASNLGAAALCAAKPKMEDGLPEVETEYSARGTRLHPYFRTTLDRSEISVDDRDLLERADRLSEHVIAQFKEAVGLDGNDPPDTDEHEVEMSGVVPGHADNILTWKGGAYACILDLKSGVRPPDEAPDNLQLACYSLLQYFRYRFEMCCVAIISPDAFGPRVTTAMYHRQDMDGVLAEIESIWQRTQDPNSQPVAGEKQCLYCRAKAKCPAYAEKFMAVEIAQAKAVSTLDNEQLVKVYRAIRFAGKIKDEVSDELRARIEAGTLLGKLRSTGSTRTLIQSGDLWIALQEKYGHVNGFASDYDTCRKLSFGDFEDLIQRLEGCTKKRAKEIADALTDPFVTKTPKAPTPIPELWLD